MANEYAVDAHALIWFLAGNQRLGEKALGALQDPGNRLYVPVIALAEACWAVARGKTGISSVAALLAGIDSDPRFVVVPLDRAILDRSHTLTAIPEMHDRLITATALQLAGTSSAVPLLTLDPDIVASGVVPVVW